jgi:tryptophan synthase beta chain
MPGATLLVNLSGRGDKDMGTAMEWFGLGKDHGEELDEQATEEPR